MQLHSDIIISISTTTQRNTLHLKSECMQYWNAVVGAEMEIKALQFTIMQIQ